MTTDRDFGCYFGDPWPSGICDEGRQVPVPVGEPCASCDTSIEADDRGSFLGNGVWPDRPALVPVHRECSLRDVVGGIGHIEDHAYWCETMHDPDGGRSRRESSLAVWEWIHRHGMPRPGNPALFVCPICGRRNYGVNDIRHGYCPACHAFTRRCSIGACDDRPAAVAGNVAVCAGHAAEIGVHPSSGSTSS